MVVLIYSARFSLCQISFCEVYKGLGISEIGLCKSGIYC